MKTIKIDALLHPTVSVEDRARKQRALDYISSMKSENPTLQHFLGYPEVDADLIASCMVDLAYMDDFVYNRYTSMPQEEHTAFRTMIFQLAKDF